MWEIEIEESNVIVFMSNGQVLLPNEKLLGHAEISEKVWNGNQKGLFTALSSDPFWFTSTFELFYNCEKLLIMQMIFVYRNTD